MGAERALDFADANSGPTGRNGVMVSSALSCRRRRFRLRLRGTMPPLLPNLAKRLLWLAVGPLLAGCANPNSEPPTYYELPLSSGASGRPAIIEGTLEQARRRGGLPREWYDPG